MAHWPNQIGLVTREERRVARGGQVLVEHAWVSSSRKAGPEGLRVARFNSRSFRVSQLDSGHKPAGLAKCARPARCSARAVIHAGSQTQSSSASRKASVTRSGVRWPGAVARAASRAFSHPDGPRITTSLLAGARRTGPARGDNPRRGLRFAEGSCVTDAVARAALGLGAEALDRRRHCLLPGWCHAVAPPCAELPEVGS